MDLIQFKVTGVVQGVNFRYYTQKQAQKLGLKGWCWNHPDESVEGVAVGPSDNMNAFRTYLKKGPPAAEVKGVEMIRETKGASDAEINEALAGATGFEVTIGYRDRRLEAAVTDMGLTRGFMRCLLYIDASEHHVAHANCTFALLSATPPNASQQGILMGRFQTDTTLFPPTHKDDREGCAPLDGFCVGTPADLDADIVASI